MLATTLASPPMGCRARSVPTSSSPWQVRPCRGLGLGLAGPVGQLPAPRQPLCSVLPAPHRALPIQCSSPSRWSRSARPCTRATRPCCGARPRGTPSHSFSGRAKTVSWTPPSWDPGRLSPSHTHPASPAAQSPWSWPGGQRCDFSPGRMHIFQNGSLVIHDVAPEDSGRYTCIAGNSCNIKHTEAPLYVVGMGPGGVSCTGSGGTSLLSHPCAHRPLYTEGTKPFLRWARAFSCVPSTRPPHRQSQVPCLDLGSPLNSPRLVGVCLFRGSRDGALVLKCFLPGLPTGPWVGREGIRPGGSGTSFLYPRGPERMVCQGKQPD